jgi:phage protein D
MSSKDLARRTEIQLVFEGVDISADINKYLLTMTYTDNEEDKTDDLQISLDDRENIWLGQWLNTSAQTDTPAAADSGTSGGWTIGDEVTVTGQPQYTSYGGKPGKMLTNYQGKITYLNLKDGVPYPIHVDQKGWFAESQVTKAQAKPETMTDSGGIKGAEISAVIIQRNWFSDGKDKVLDCGTFEVDGLDASGPPTKITIKGTSIPYKSSVRTQKKSKAWEKIKLSAIANEIAAASGLKCMFESDYDPLYSRVEQVQESDIVFLQRLCKNAGISLKATARIIVLFDAAAYEQKDAVRSIIKGSSDVLSYRFGTKFNDTAYSSCHVTYTDPATSETIEYTYKPENAEGNGQVLEVNEKVTSKEEARQLAMKRLRQKNKAEFTAEFTLVGDLDLVAGVTVMVSGYGMFDGKYIIETATHQLTGGYNVSLKLRRVLEGY